MHHINIVPIFAVGNHHGVNYYAMQLVDGQSLDQVLKQSDQPLDPKTAAEWGLQAAEALVHAHQRDVIHRDVKPSNLILDDEGRLGLTDFGLAKQMDDVTLSMTGALLGTPRYMSPEQADASTRKLDHRTDIYSLGATLYELVTGQPVFAADTPHGVISQLPRGVRSEFEIVPGDDLLPELEIERTVALIHFPGRTQPLLIDDDGLRLHGRASVQWALNLAQPTEQRLTDVAGFVWPWDAGILYPQRGGYDKFDLRPFLARWSTSGNDRNSDPWTAIPSGDAVDLDGDDTADFVLAARHQAWMMAVSGKSGSVLWFIRRGQEFRPGVDEEFRRRRQRHGGHRIRTCQFATASISWERISWKL